MWVVSEIAAMATDLAEFLGGAIGLSLLFGMPLLLGMVVTGHRLRHPDVREVWLPADRADHRRLHRRDRLLLPDRVVHRAARLARRRLPHRGAATRRRGGALLAVGIIGATVMPHAIYLHSGLTQSRVPARDDGEKRRIVRFSNREVHGRARRRRPGEHGDGDDGVQCFHAGHGDVAEIETAYHTLEPLLGIGAAGVFMLSLLASGVSSSAVGTMAGQMIMQGFVGFRIPIWVDAW